MTIQHDDERITAYALGELSEAEAAEFETALADDEQAQAAVDDVRAMAALLTEEFAAEDALSLGDTHRAELEALMDQADQDPEKERLAAVGAAGATDEQPPQATETSSTGSGSQGGGGNVVQGPWGKIAGGVAIVTALAAATVLFMNVNADKTPAGDTLAYDKTESQKARSTATESASAPQLEAAPVKRAESKPTNGVERTNAAAAPTMKPGSAAVLEGEDKEGGGADDDSAKLDGKFGGAELEEAPAPTADAPTDPTNVPADRKNQLLAKGETKFKVFGSGAKDDASVRWRGDGAAVGGMGAAGGKKADRPMRAAPKASSKKRKKRVVHHAKRPAPARPVFREPPTERERRVDNWRKPPPPGGEGAGKGLVQEKSDKQDRRLAYVMSLRENPFKTVLAAPLSTFSVDVDTASYAQVRQFINRNMMPPADVIRIEEMVNYFEYKYAAPAANADHPFAAKVDVAQAPWNPKHRLVRIGIKGAEVPRHKRPSTNLVFLLDVSGSMSSRQKLPLMKYGMKSLVDQLGPDDRVAIVTYAGDSGVALTSTAVDGVGRTKIVNVIDGLVASGSTNGSDGLKLAYEQAVRGFAEGGINRVVLASDGDFNVGISDKRQLTKLIAQKAKSGVFLTVLGLGMGNYKDGLLETLANKGNGNYAYLDSQAEARKVLVDQMLGNMLTIAKDVKIQVEFNPAKASAYRLIGYENRKLASKDFANDSKDAGEIGAGHTVTALYEVVPAGVSTEGIKLKYKPTVATNDSPDLLTLKLRYKRPKGTKSILMEQSVVDSGKRLSQADPDFQFAAAVAAFGMVLGGSKHIGKLGLSAVEELAAPGLGDDPKGHRREFIRLVKQARRLR